MLLSIAIRFLRLWYNELLVRPGTTAVAAISKGRKHPQERSVKNPSPWSRWVEPPAACRADSRFWGCLVVQSHHPWQRAALSAQGFPAWDARWSSDAADPLAFSV